MTLRIGVRFCPPVEVISYKFDLYLFLWKDINPLIFYIYFSSFLQSFVVVVVVLIE